jgi:predicted DNA-binding transcriptional regulator AlpA
MNPNNLTTTRRVWRMQTLAQAADVSLSTIKRCAKRGELTVIKLSPRRVGILDEEATRWLTSRPKAA